ncbi:S41 family peptidase [Candidatus Bipolaricaulota bacterium]
MTADAINREVINRVSGKINALLQENYVFPDRVPAIVAESQARLNVVSGFESLDALCKQMTDDLRDISKDCHMLVRYVERPIDKGTSEEPSEMEIEEEMLEARLDGGGIHRVERLAGNIGLIEIRDFYPPRHHADVIPAAMKLVAGTDALIFDLRRNCGGYPDTVAIWMGYLFEETTHLIDLEWRHLKRTDSFWSLPYVPGAPYLDRPLYVLIGPKTVSGGEMFAYALKNRNMATLVGETTKGAAHGRIMFAAEEHIAAHIPAGYPSDPLTGTNWEGVGVAPDISVSSEDAFDRAYSIALVSVADRYQGQDGPRSKVHKEARAAIEEGASTQHGTSDERRQ